MKFKVLVACVLLAVVVPGCRRKKAEVPVPEPPAPAQITPTSPTGAPVASGNEAQMAASNATVLTAMMQTFIAQNGRMPNDVSELATVKGYGPVPKAPAGYKFVIDGKQKQVVAVKQ